MIPKMPLELCEEEVSVMFVVIKVIVLVLEVVPLNVIKKCSFVAQEDIFLYGVV